MSETLSSGNSSTKLVQIAELARKHPLQSERRAGRPAHDDRRFIEAVLWWRRTGVPWRDLPSDFGRGRPCSTASTAGRKLASGTACCRRSKLKQARRFATRYEKTLRNYAAVVALGCALLWLRI
jgi:transposase